jgi:hypothetical protein
VRGLIKSLELCNPNFGEVLGYLQECSSDAESESELAVGRDSNMDCVSAE